MEQDDCSIDSQLSSFIQANFDQIREGYIGMRMTESVISPGNKFEKWRNSFRELTKYTSFHKLPSLYINELVNSTDFDKNEELFVTGGSVKQLKVYSYASVIDNGGFPIQILNCEGKISSVSFNCCLNGKLGSCGHDKSVILSDIYMGSHVRISKEH